MVAMRLERGCRRAQMRVSQFQSLLTKREHKQIDAVGLRCLIYGKRFASSAARVR